MALVKIDQQDIGKTKIQLLMDLIYETTRMRIPQHRIVYGKPKELDVRPDDLWDANTFIPVKIDPTYSFELSRLAGFMYRRLSIVDYFRENEVSLEFVRFPTTIREFLQQVINPQLPVPIDEADFIDAPINDPEATSIRLTVHPESLLWFGKNVLFPIAPPDNSFLILVEIPELSGFYEYEITP